MNIFKSRDKTKIEIDTNKYKTIDELIVEALKFYYILFNKTSSYIKTIFALSIKNDEIGINQLRNIPANQIDKDTDKAKVIIDHINNICDKWEEITKQNIDKKDNCIENYINQQSSIKCALKYIISKTLEFSYNKSRQCDEIINILKTIPNKEIDNLEAFKEYLQSENDNEFVININRHINKLINPLPSNPITPNNSNIPYDTTSSDGISYNTKQTESVRTHPPTKEEEAIKDRELAKKLQEAANEWGNKYLKYKAKYLALKKELNMN